MVNGHIRIQEQRRGNPTRLRVCSVGSAAVNFEMKEARDAHVKVSEQEIEIAIRATVSDNGLEVVVTIQRSSTKRRCPHQRGVYKHGAAIYEAVFASRTEAKRRA